MTRLRGKGGGDGGRKQVKDSEDDDDDNEDESGSENESGDEDGEKESGPESDELWTYDSNKEECKLVLVVRTDLGMGKGTHPHQPPQWKQTPLLFPSPSPIKNPPN